MRGFSDDKVEFLAKHNLEFSRVLRASLGASNKLAFITRMLVHRSHLNLFGAKTDSENKDNIHKLHYEIRI